MAELNFHHLRYFWAVAHEGNLTRAAERLHVSQSAVSVQIKQLEQQLGHELFERRGRQEELERARRLRHVLLPRRGGPFALLEANRHREVPADIVFCAHTGFEGSARLSDLAHGRLVGTTVRAHLWRVPAEAVPEDLSERKRWLWDEWEKVELYVRGESLAPARVDAAEGST